MLTMIVTVVYPIYNYTVSDNSTLYSTLALVLASWQLQPTITLILPKSYSNLNTALLR